MRTPVLFSALVASTCLLAQPTFQSAQLTPVFGSTVTVRNADYRAPGPATNGFTYNVGDLTLGSASTSQYSQPSSTPYASTFPNATYATGSLTNPGNYGYVQVTSTQELLLGTKSPDTEMIFTDPMQTLKFPLALGTTWSDNLAGSTTSSGFTFNRTGTSVGNYNGYGTLVLPFGTFTNVARVQIDQTFTDEIMGFTTESETHTVSYIAPGYTFALFTTSVVLVDAGLGLDTAASYSIVIDSSMVGIRENPAAIGAVLAPNPATGSTSLKLATPAPGLAVNIMDAAGRVVRQVATAINEQRIAINVEGLAPGLYHVRATDNTGATGNWPLMVE